MTDEILEKLTQAKTYDFIFTALKLFKIKVPDNIKTASVGIATSIATLIIALIDNDKAKAVQAG